MKNTQECAVRRKKAGNGISVSGSAARGVRQAPCSFQRPRTSSGLAEDWVTVEVSGNGTPSTVAFEVMF